MKKINRFSFITWVIFMVFSANIYAQSKLSKATEHLLQQKGIETASISIMVKEVETGRIIHQHQAQRSLSPASSMKVVTTATALAILGKDFRFKTTLEYDGKIENGILVGNLYIKGFGDPTLGGKRPKGNLSSISLLVLFSNKIKALGIKKIQGKIVADATYFDTASTPSSWQWDDLGNYYGAGVYGLNINENKYLLSLKQQTQLGQKPTVLGTKPKLHNTLFINELTSDKKGTGDNCYIYAAPRQHTRILRGTIPVGTGIFRVKGSLPDPPLTLASMLLNFLEKQGITTTKGATSIFLSKAQNISFPTHRTAIYTHLSPTLWEIAQVTNEESVNLFSEALLKMIGKKVKGKGTNQKGIESIEEFWADRGVNMKGFFMMDGSGLSARNGISAGQLASILRKIKVDKTLGFNFLKTLPIAGKTGTLRWMFKNTSATGKIFAKTGSMDRIRSYSGYAKTSKGKLISFAIIMNNYSCTNREARNMMKKWMLELPLL